MTVLRAQGLSRRFPVRAGRLAARRWLHAVNGVTLEMRQKETLAIVGESGSGKSTLGRLLALIEQPDAGTLEIAGERATPENRARMRPLVQMVFQNPHACLNPRKTLEDILDEPLRINTPLGRAARDLEIDAMLERVGLSPKYRRRYPHMFSGGQRQRIAIARAMMLKPRLVIADEPTSALDVSIQAQIINLFRELEARHETSFLFISHDLGVVRHVARRVAVMYLGTIVEEAPTETLFQSPRHPYTRALLSTHPTLGGEWRRIPLTGEPPSPLEHTDGCPFRQRCPLADARCANEAPVLLPQDGDASHLAACHLQGTGGA
ncbi:MAG: ATP-binding cassette domain-containing protein [Zoogloeaceae bacterium]|nr:ATP-binding cassette domain-containing protein [Zoogloeaceae bacterium]